MDLGRRALVGGLAAAGLGPTAAGGAERDGRRPITQDQLDRVFRSYAVGGDLVCVAATPITEGPFYYESSLQRRAIAERMPGVPLRLGIRLGGLSRLEGHCLPVAGAIVDIWHASATGLYSNVGKALQPVDTTGQTFMRGHQVTDETGYVEFDTIVPGWEIVAGRLGGPKAAVFPASRTTHIHVKAFYEREVLTTQLFLPDSLLDQLYAEVEPYKSHGVMTAPGLDRTYARIKNGADPFFAESKAKPLTLERINGVLTAKVTLGVLSQDLQGVRTLFR